MKAIQVHQFVNDFDSTTDAHMSLAQDVEKPSLQKGQILVKVQACSISPGDTMMATGNMYLLHPSSFPYTPGMDVCGVVEDANGSTTFKKGDVVVAANGISPVGGLAEFMAVDESEAVIKPSNVSVQEGAASSSAISARRAVESVKQGDRVLILGGSGGVGSAAIQIAKMSGASYIATTSTQTKLCKDLGADRVINYHDEDWWTIPEFQSNKFDVIVDTVGGGNFYGRATEVLKTGKQGGTFVAVTGDDPKPVAPTLWKAIKFIASMPLRPIYTWLRSGTYPKYVLTLPSDSATGRKQVLEWMQKGQLKIQLEKEFDFTAAGVRQAFAKVASGHAHGKVVISVAKK